VLVEESQALRRELETLMGAPFDVKACVTYRHKLRAYRGVLGTMRSQSGGRCSHRTYNAPSSPTVAVPA